jgi:hydroxymethylpyrimidine/phosphomethylpyrimidine kinase
MPTALTIAGSDPSGGAGIQADLKTFAAHGVYGVSAVTAITVQNTLGVTAVVPLAADIVSAQVEALAGDLTINATKIGMLATAAVVEAVAASIEELELPLVVVDPVLRSSSGAELLDVDGVQALIRELLPLARVVTPNIPEAEALSGYPIGSASDARKAADRIRKMGARAVVITGGHGQDDEVIDLLLDEDFAELRTPRVLGPRAHGTGCTYASAIAAELALGYSLIEAARRAQAYVVGALAGALRIGTGALSLNHFWQQR